jgi:hypothetical protein
MSSRSGRKIEVSLAFLTQSGMRERLAKDAMMPHSLVERGANDRICNRHDLSGTDEEPVKHPRPDRRMAVQFFRSAGSNRIPRSKPAEPYLLVRIYYHSVYCQ